MGIINVVQMLKKMHPQYVILIEIGTFYYIYGKDSYIMSYLFGYTLRKVEKIYTCAFPKNSLNKVIVGLEKKKINYIIVDKQNNYNIDFKDKNNNLNRYEEIYEKAKEYINLKSRVDNINKFLNNNINKKDIHKILLEIEDVINENSDKI